MYQWEKLVTYLSVEANFPSTTQDRSRYEIYVACCSGSGEVWGMVEIDARDRGGRSQSYYQSGGSAYMCNLAVDRRRERNGIASALVHECEKKVQEWYSISNKDKRSSDDNDELSGISSTDMSRNEEKKNGIKIPTMSNSICLKVRESNKEAVQLYMKLGYVTMLQEKEDKTNETVLLMRKKLSSTPPLEGF